MSLCTQLLWVGRLLYWKILITAMPPKRVASEAAKATQGRACFEGRCGSAFLASCGRASPVAPLCLRDHGGKPPQNSCLINGVESVDEVQLEKTFVGIGAVRMGRFSTQEWGQLQPYAVDALQSSHKCSLVQQRSHARSCGQLSPYPPLQNQGRYRQGTARKPADWIGLAAQRDVCAGNDDCCVLFKTGRIQRGSAGPRGTFCSQQQTTSVAGYQERVILILAVCWVRASPLLARALGLPRAGKTIALCKFTELMQWQHSLASTQEDVRLAALNRLGWSA